MGNSVATCTVCVDEAPVCPCHPQMSCQGGSVYPATNCCQADPAHRYHAVVAAFPASELHSLCATSYVSALATVFNNTL